MLEMRQMRALGAAGFTVVELVTVITVMAILAIGTTRFLTDATDGFVTTGTRAALVDDAQATLMSLARDVRRAMPMSIRVDGAGVCLEFVPVVQGTLYTSAPVGFGGSSVWTLPVSGYTPDAQTRLGIFAFSAPYTLGSNAPISPVISSSTVEADGQLRLDLAATHEFPSDSSHNRLYFVDNPRSYCLDNGALWRYDNYGFIAAQPDASTLPGVLPNRVLVAESLTGALPAFAYAEAALNRNATVAVSLVVAQGGEEVRLDQLIHVRNLP